MKSPKWCTDTRTHIIFSIIVCDYLYSHRQNEEYTFQFSIFYTRPIFKLFRGFDDDNDNLDLDYTMLIQDDNLAKIQSDFCIEMVEKVESKTTKIDPSPLTKFRYRVLTTLTLSGPPREPQKYPEEKASLVLGI